MTGTKDDSSAIPPVIRITAQLSDAKSIWTDNGITRFTLLKISGKRLLRESRNRYASGFHHPAFSVSVRFDSGDSFTACQYSCHFSTSVRKLQVDS